MSGAPPLKKVRRGLMPKGLFIKLVIKYLDFAPRAQQQQQTTTVAGSALRRMVLALAIAAVMAAMVLATTAPAFAKSERQEQLFRCVADEEVFGGVTSGEAHRGCTPPGPGVARI
jgi:hypothetical protein